MQRMGYDSVKRIVSIVLAIILLAGSIPLSSFAQTPESQNITQQQLVHKVVNGELVQYPRKEWIP